MLNAMRLPASNPAAIIYSAQVFSPRRLSLRLQSRRRFASFTAQSLENASSGPSDSSHFTSSIGFPSAVHFAPLTVTHRHIQILSFFACAAAVSATWLFCSAIPALLAFKRAAESLEKLMDTTREELPDTMAAIRLSGMEISDLTMELSDLGQEITQGVKSSTRAVGLAEERLRRLTKINPTVPVQEAKLEKTDPVVARSARSAREGIVKGRMALQMFFTLTRYSKILLRYLTSRAKS